MPFHSKEYLSRLFNNGFIPVPLIPGSKHLDIEAMGFDAIHFITRKKYLQYLSYASVCYCLSQKPPKLDEIFDWFDGYNGNVGVLGGFKGLVVLDFDKIRYYEKWRERYNRALRDVLTVQTPKGFHVYLSCDTPIITSSMYWGYRKVGHIKSLGGYVVIPPSQLSDTRAYSWPNGDPLISRPLKVNHIGELGINEESPIKTMHDKFLNRGYFTVK